MQQAVIFLPIVARFCLFHFNRRRLGFLNYELIVSIPEIGIFLAFVQKKKLNLNWTDKFWSRDVRQAKMAVIEWSVENIIRSVGYR